MRSSWLSVLLSRSSARPGNATRISQPSRGVGVLGVLPFLMIWVIASIQYSEFVSQQIILDRKKMTEKKNPR